MNSSDNPTSLKGLFQGLIPDPCGVLQGKVISASPLKIQAENDSKLIINASLLIVPKHLTEYEATVDIEVDDGALDAATNTAGVEAHSHKLNSFTLTKGKLTVHNELKVGEKVHLLSLNNGKKYYILDRVV